ncbi:hypothetical protein Mapa_005841 [Marchantia paleacea]|nr:hypothetical protein Mapa_005841 [Marchantia paleacea]
MATCNAVRPVACSILGNMLQQCSSSWSARNVSHLNVSALTHLQGISLNTTRRAEDRPNKRIIGTNRVLTTASTTANGSDGAPTTDVVKKNESSVPLTENESTNVQSIKGSSPRPLLRSLAGDLDEFLPTVRSLRQMLDSMDRMFDDPFFSPARQMLPLGSKQLRNRIRTPWDVMEDEKAYLLRVDIPGFSKEQVKVYVEEGHLVIKADQGSEEKNSKFASRSYGTFSSRLLLPENVEFEKISAELTNGVLIVTVPKLEKPPKKDAIDIRVL